MSEEFWADEIKRYRDQPKKRLAFALQHLPLPAAFREAAIALRALIRERRRGDLRYDDHLRRLYRLACIHDFLYATPQVDGLPSYNFAAHVSVEELESRDFPYDEIGYDQLELLKKTDKKWLRAQWGTPSRHCSVRDHLESLWSTWLAEYREAR